MGDELYVAPLPLAGEPIAIPLDRWKVAVSATTGVRLWFIGYHEIVSPSTDERIRIPVQEGDVEMYVAGEGVRRPGDSLVRGSSALRGSDSSQPAATRYDSRSPRCRVDSAALSAAS